MLGLGGGPDGCLGGLPTSTPTSSPPPHRGMYKEGDRGHLRLPSHTLATAGQSGDFLLLESGSTEPLGFEENTCLHFHGLGVGLLLFFACGEGRTKGTVAELREWLRGPALCLSSLPWGRGSSNRLVVPVSNLMAHHAPGTMLQGLRARLEQRRDWAGLEAHIWMTEKPGLWFWPINCLRHTEGVV